MRQAARAELSNLSKSSPKLATLTGKIVRWLHGQVSASSHNFTVYLWYVSIHMVHCKPIPVMKTGFSLGSFSHWEKPVFITGNPVFITGMGLQCWLEEYSSSGHFFS